jgi:hypothetical protein
VLLIGAEQLDCGMTRTSQTHKPPIGLK